VAAPPKSPRRPSRKSLLRTLGILCFVAALGVGAYYSWQLWGTGIGTARAQKQLRAAITQQIANPRSGSGPDRGAGDHAPRAKPPHVSFVNGAPLAIIQIPRMKLDMVVVEGVGVSDLTKGPGHYRGTAYPWEEHGRVAIAGHRTTYLHPFWSLDTLRRGDLVRLVTEFGKFDYRVTGSRVVLPGDISVLNPTDEPTLVLTACYPRFSNSRRLVVFASR
jgi:sortase A